MNAQRRKQLNAAIAKIEEAKIDIESLQSEEQEAFDNMPESIQCGDRGQAMEQTADALQQAVDELENTLHDLTGIE